MPMKVLFWTILLLCLSVTTVTSKANNITAVYNVREDLSLQTCKADLEAADINGNEEIDGDEWAIFVTRQSNFRLSADSYQEVHIAFIMIFISVSCQCVQIPGGDSDCCLGRNANIDIRNLNSPERLRYIFEVCVRTKLTIYNLLGPPPTLEPTVTVTMTPSEFVNSTIHPTRTPSLTPSLSNAPTNQPTTNPTVLTISPTATSSSNPSEVKSSEPSPSPSGRPSAHPSAYPSFAPSVQASNSPTAIPSSGPSENPKKLEFFFPYGLVVDGNLTADDIINDRNNSVRNDLVVATKTIVVRTLNATYPVVEPFEPSNNTGLITPLVRGRLNHRFESRDVFAWSHAQRDGAGTTNGGGGGGSGGGGDDGGGGSGSSSRVLIKRVFEVDDRFRRSRADDEDELSPPEEERLGSREEDEDDDHAWFARASHSEDLIPDDEGGRGARRSRVDHVRVGIRNRVRRPNRLAAPPPVYYTDLYPIVVFQVFDDECLRPTLNDPGQNCVIVRSLITVIVEDDSLDRGVIREQLVEGLRDSFKDGSFLEALP